MPSKKPSPPKRNNHHQNPDWDEVVGLLADVPADKLPGLLAEVQEIAKQGAKAE